MTNEEQYLVELINRARLDPLAEAARMGIDLNAGLAPGTISEDAKGVLAPNAALRLASQAHSEWMLETGTFSHTGEGDSTPGQRATAAGYNWNAIGENLAWAQRWPAISSEAFIDIHHDGLFLSAGHRRNMLNPNYKEVGVFQATGDVEVSFSTQPARQSYLTEKFGRSGTGIFLTGVAYDDANGNGFYSVGEGVAGVTFTIGSALATSTATGGYALQLAAATGPVIVAVSRGGITGSVRVDMAGENRKLDLIGYSRLAGSGNMTLEGGISDADLLGSAALSLAGNSAANRLNGNRGDNTISGGNGNDTIRGFDGDDSINSGAGNDLVYGGDGADTVFGGTGRDTIWGGNGADRLSGWTGNDLVYGGAGADTIYGGDGNDTAYGGTGADLIYGGDGADTLRGGDNNDTVYGGVGNDTVRGDAGSDRVYGGSGDDLVYGGTGNDRAYGGTGSDTVYGGDDNDIVDGGADDDIVYGGNGRDTVYGGSGHDTAYGGAGDDIVFGGDGDDVIFGGSGNDTIHAGSGRDTMSGGTGADVFVYDSAAHIGLSRWDVITDFTPGSDRIDLRAVDANTLVAGNQAFSFVSGAGFVAGQAGRLRYDPSTGYLQGDTNGSGNANFTLVLQGAPNLGADDLLL